MRSDLLHVYLTYGYDGTIDKLMEYGDTLEFYICQHCGYENMVATGCNDQCCARCKGCGNKRTMTRF